VVDILKPTQISPEEKQITQITQMLEIAQLETVLHL
jgi:hypothetical protein